MNKTFSQLKTSVGNNIQDTSSSTATVIGQYINNIYFDALRRFNFDIYNYDYSITTDGSQDYILPRDFGKELYVVDTTNKVDIEFKSLQHQSQDHSGSLDSTGSSYFYSILERRFNNNPSSSSIITVVSSSSNDTVETVLVRGISGNVERIEEITLNGTSSVDGSVSFSRIIAVSKSAVTEGYITLTSNSGAVTIAEFSPQEIAYLRKFIRFLYIPSSGNVIDVPYKIQPLPLYNDTDVPLIADDVIEYGATMFAWRYKRQMAKAEEWRKTYVEAVNNLIWDQDNQINQLEQISVEPYSRNMY